MEFTVYSGNGCKYCALAKLFIHANGGTVIERNIDTDDVARKDWEAFDVLGVPVITANGQTLIGFTDEVRAQVIGILEGETN